MSDPRPQITTLDLRTEVPTGVKLVGLSDAKFDGINYYRTPLGKESFVDFTNNKYDFIQLNYQLYSHSEDVLSIVKLDGKEIGRYNFQKDRIDEIERMGSFVDSGKKNFVLQYKCNGVDCLSSIRQYRSEIFLINYPKKSKVERVGFNTERISSDFPKSNVKILNTGSIFYDGTRFARRITHNEGSIKWENVKPISVGAYIYAPQDIIVKISILGQIVATQRGDKMNSVPIAIPLARFPVARSVSFRVECLGSPVKTGCAYLYFPQVAVSTAPPVSVGGQLGVVALVMLCLLGLWAWLRPVPVSGERSFP